MPPGAFPALDRDRRHPLSSKPQVDRMWAAWQEANLSSGDPAQRDHHGNPGFPEAFLGPLFNFTEVLASETFDYKALGYEYDSLPKR